MDSTLRNRLIVAFYIPSALMSIAWAVLTPVLPVYAASLTEAFLIIGVMLAAVSLGRVAGSLPSSWLLNRFGIKYTMVIGISVVLANVLILFFVRNLWTIIGLLLLTGVGLSIYSIARHTYISVVIPLEIRGRAISVLGGVFRVGLFIGPLIGGWVGGLFGLPAAFLAYFVFGLFGLFFVLFFMQNVGNNVSEKRQSVSFRKMLRENYRIITAAGIGQWMVMLTREGWRVLIPLYAATSLGLDVQTIGAVVGIGAAFDMLFFWVSGIVMDRYGRKFAIVPSFVIQGIGIALILIAPNAVALTAVAAFIGFGNGLSSGTMMTTGADLAPDDTRNEFLSMWHFIGDMGGVSGPLIVGAVAQAFVIQMSVVAVAATGFGAALIFARFVPETLQRRKEKPKVTAASS